MFTSGSAGQDFNGTWILDLKASDSPESMLKRMGISFLERKLAATIELDAKYSQSSTELSIDTHGLAFSRRENLHLDGTEQTNAE